MTRYFDFNDFDSGYHRGCRKKKGYFLVRLTVTDNFSRIFYGVFKKQVFLAQKHSVKPFLVDQNFHICLRIFYGQAGRKGAESRKKIFFLGIFPK